MKQQEVSAKEEKVYFISEDRFEFVCSSCSHSFEVNARNKIGTVKIRCKCEHVERIILNRRKSIRKSVKITGYINTQKKGGIVVNDISRGGIGLSVSADASSLNIGDKVEVVLSTIQKGIEKEIRFDAIVRSIGTNGRIGLEFHNLEDYYEANRTIRFMLM
jgi:hypothetical protein